MHDSTRNMLDATANSGGLQRPPLQRVRKAGKVCKKPVPVWSRMACVSHTQRGPTEPLIKEGEKGIREAKAIKEKKKEEKQDCSTRMAPVTYEEEGQKQKKKGKKDSKVQKQLTIISHVVYERSTQPPRQDLID